MPNTEYKPPKSLQVAVVRFPNFVLDDETQRHIDSSKQKIREMFEEAVKLPFPESDAKNT